MLLTAGPERLAAEPPRRFTHAWAELMIVSLVWGLATVGIWAAAWKLFGEPMGRLMPAVAVAEAFTLWPFRRALMGTVEILLGADSSLRAMACSIFVLVLTLAMLSLQPDYYRRDADLHWVIAWFRPWVKIYRPLILMPLWGAWAMLITPQFCRPRPNTEPAVAAFAQSCRPVAAAAVMGLLLAATITYFNFLPWAQLAISGATIFAAIAAGMIFCRKTGGLTRRALLAANISTQMVFLLAYLVTRNFLLW